MKRTWYVIALVLLLKLTALSAFVAGMLLFRHAQPWEHEGWKGLGQAYYYFFALIAFGVITLKCFPPLSLVTRGVSPWVFRLITAVLAVLYGINYLKDLSYNPLTLGGEWRIASSASAMIWNRLAHGIYALPPGYNLGVGYLYLPLYAIWGESIWAMKLMYFACWTLAVYALAAVWRRERGWEGLFSILLVVSTLAYGEAVERTYKWHVMAAYLSAALFWLCARLHRRRGVADYLLCIGALALAIIGYHGCIIYAIFLALYGVSAAAFKDKGKRTSPAAGAVLGLGFLAVATACVYAWPACLGRYLGHFLQGRLLVVIRVGYANGNGARNVMYIAKSFLAMFFVRMSPLASLALVAGLGAALIDFKKAWDARFLTVGFWLLWLCTMALYPLYNLDEANYFVIFVFLAMAYGFYAVLVRIGSARLCACAVVAFAACLAWQEGDIYARYYRHHSGMGMQPSNADTQGAIALYDLRLTEQPGESEVFFPAPGLRGELGGFEQGCHVGGLPMYEYSAWRGKLRYFGSLDSLRQQVEKAFAERKGRTTRVTAYLSSNVARAALADKFKGLRYHFSEVAYFEKEWGVRIPFYKLVFYGMDPRISEIPSPAVQSAGGESVGGLPGTPR